MPNNPFKIFLNIFTFRIYKILHTSTVFIDKLGKIFFIIFRNETLIKDVHLLGAGENMILSFVDTLKMEKKDKYWDLADRVYALNKHCRFLS